MRLHYPVDGEQGPFQVIQFDTSLFCSISSCSFRRNEKVLHNQDVWGRSQISERKYKMTTDHDPIMSVKIAGLLFILMSCLLLPIRSHHAYRRSGTTCDPRRFSGPSGLDFSWNGQSVTEREQTSCIFPRRVTKSTNQLSQTYLINVSFLLFTRLACEQSCFPLVLSPDFKLVCHHI